MFTLRSIIRLALVVVAFLTVVGRSPLRAVTIVPTTSTFLFTGDCLDCTGQGKGTLVLQNYTLGNPFDISNFVSFSYTSNLTSFVLTGTGSGPNQASAFSGSLPALLPAFADVNIDSQSMQIFNSVSSGSWCAGFNGCSLDFGINGTFASTVPEPASLAFTVTGLALLGLWRVKARRSKAGHQYR